MEGSRNGKDTLVGRVDELLVNVLDEVVLCGPVRNQFGMKEKDNIPERTH